MNKLNIPELTAALTAAQRAHLKHMTIRLLTEPYLLHRWLAELTPAVYHAWVADILAEAYWLLNERPKNPRRWCWRDGDREVNFAMVVREICDDDLWMAVDDGFAAACLRKP